MVHFPAYLACTLFDSCACANHPDWRVTPFGHPGIVGYWHLLPAFRSLSRPSSSGGSQASSVDPYSLDHIIHYILRYIKKNNFHGGKGIRTLDTRLAKPVL